MNEKRDERAKATKIREPVRYNAHVGQPVQRHSTQFS